MTWIHKEQKRPYSYKKDDTIIDKSKTTKKQLAKIAILSIVWFKTKRGKVFQSTFDEVTKKKIKWEWWQPIFKINA